MINKIKSALVAFGVLVLCLALLFMMGLSMLAQMGFRWGPGAA